LLGGRVAVEPARGAAPLARTAFRPLHHAGAAAGDDREPRLCQQPADLAGLGVDGILLSDPRRAEDGDRRPVDPLDGLEPFEELLADALCVADEVALAALEHPSV